ncbi:MAG: hypothetical protein ABXS91_04460, partial [Sulfurimonas sp.]
IAPNTFGVKGFCRKNLKKIVFFHLLTLYKEIKSILMLILPFLSSVIQDDHMNQNHTSSRERKKK